MFDYDVLEETMDFPEKNHTRAIRRKRAKKKANRLLRIEQIFFFQLRSPQVSSYTSFFCQAAEKVFLKLAPDDQKSVSTPESKAVGVFLRKLPHPLEPNVEILRCLPDRQNVFFMYCYAVLLHKKALLFMVFSAYHTSLCAPLKSTTFGRVTVLISRTFFAGIPRT